MAELNEIIRWLDTLLQPQDFSDYGPNGLQVPGPPEIRTIATGVSGGLQLFEKAAEINADLVLVHHGILRDAKPTEIDEYQYRRLKTLFDNGMSLAAYHIPLDAHTEVGNNALIASAIGLDEQRPFALHEGKSVGIAGSYPDGIATEELIKRVTAAVGGREPLVFAAGPDPIRSVGIISGGASSYMHFAIEQGLDAFITGEPTESAMNEAVESGITFIAAGHYATETFGVRRLGELIAERFGVSHQFIDVPNPI